MINIIIKYYSKFRLGLVLTIIFLSHIEASISQKASDSPKSIVITFFPYSDYGGTSNSAIKQHLALLNAGIPSVFIGKNNEKIKNTPFIQCSSVENGYSILEEIINEKKESIAIIHCHNMENVEPINRITKKYDIPLVFSLHYPWSLSQKIRTAAAGIICVNKEMVTVQSQLNAADGTTTPVIAMPPFFTPPKPCIFSKNQRDEFFKSQFGIELKPIPLLLKVAHFYPDKMHKNHDLLLQAIHTLIYERNIPVQVVLAGSHNRIDICKKLAKNLKIENYVYFVGRTDQTAQLFESADINLLSSSKEGFGLVLLEGGLFKKPTIVSRQGCGAADWLITDKETGFLFENKNATDLADKIEYALTHQEEAKACGQRLYEKVINEFLPDKIVQDLLKFYQLVQPKFVLPIQ